MPCRWWCGALVVLGVIGLVLGITLAVHQGVAPRETDDVHPDIPCTDHMLNDSTWLWVIPWYGDVPLTAHPAWVDALKRSGKKLGLHGVRHTYREFATDVSRAYVQKGIDEFEKAFGYRPTAFKPPKMQITPRNRQLLAELGLTVRTDWQQMIHRIYHCPDHGRTDRGRLRYEVARTEHDPIHPVLH